MPLLVQVVLVTVPFVAPVFGARRLLSRHLPPLVIDHGEKVVPIIVGSFGGFFGLVAGFMLSNSWLELRNLRNAMAAEVNSLADMGDIAANLPAPRSHEWEKQDDRHSPTLRHARADTVAVARNSAGRSRRAPSSARRTPSASRSAPYTGVPGCCFHECARLPASTPSNPSSSIKSITFRFAATSSPATGSAMRPA